MGRKTGKPFKGIKRTQGNIIKKLFGSTLRKRFVARSLRRRIIRGENEDPRNLWKPKKGKY
ncbi:MAG: hypothetical protein HYW05_03550 [Candidatus Diapherotrites archaeon]|nr:hypothetical protein [Candidatus Diapherotrites archaeon]